MLTEAVILAGGLGTRLRSVIKDLPKPMAEVNGKPFLHYLFVYLKNQGIKSVVLSVGYKHEIIQHHFGDNYIGIRIHYAIEDSPLGTGGAIKLAMEHITEERCYVLNGDTYFDIDLHLLSQLKGGCVIAAKMLTNFDRYGTISINTEGEVEQFIEKKYSEKGFINGGVYCLEKSIFSTITEAKFSFETAVLEPLSSQGKVQAVKCDGYFKDMGIPEDYAQIERDFIQKKI